MKGLFQKTILALLVISLILSVSACGKAPADGSTDSTASNESATTAVSSDNNTDADADSSKTDASTDSSKTDVSSATSNTSSKNNSSKNNGNTTTSNTSSKNNTSTNNSSKVETTSKLGTVPKELKGTTVKVLSWNDITDVATAADVVKKFREKTGINVTWIKVGYDEYQSKLAAMVAANDSPDVLRLEGPNPALMSLMQPVTTSGYDFKEDIWDDFISDIYSYNGKTYAVNRKNTLIQQPFVMLYNRSYITQYDLEDPYAIWKKNKSNWNMDKFIEICEDYKKVSGSTTAPWLGGHIHEIASTIGMGEVIREGDKYVNNLGNKKLLSLYQDLATYKSKNLIYSTTWDYAGFNQGKYLFFSTAIIGARRTHFYFKDLKNAGSLGVVPMPAVKGQKKYYQNLSEAEAYGIAKGAKNAKAVPYFLSYYLDGDNYDANTFFNDKTMLDVYKYCMEQTTLTYDYTRNVCKRFYGKDQYYEYETKLKAASPDQITTLFNTYKPVVSEAVKSANEKLKDVG